MLRSYRFTMIKDAKCLNIYTIPRNLIVGESLILRKDQMCYTCNSSSVLKDNNKKRAYNITIKYSYIFLFVKSSLNNDIIISIYIF